MMDRTDVERLRTLEVLVERMEKAIELQAIEYERRLDQLNHAYKQAQIEREKFVSVERMQGYTEKMDVWQEHINDKLSTMSGVTKGRSTQLATILSVLAVIIAVAAVISQFF